MVVHLALTELRLLLRKGLTVVSVVLVPIGLCAVTWLQYRDLPAAEWPKQLSFMFVTLLALSVFLVSTTVFTARRQSLVLQRLRTSELTDNGVYAGIAGPIMVMGLVQLIVYFGFCVAVGAPMPAQPLLVLVAFVLGLPTALLAGIATAAFSRSVEMTQITAIPVLFAVLAGTFLALSPNPTLVKVSAYLPMTGPGALLTDGWSGTATAQAVTSSVVWLVVLGYVAKRFFTWEPRQ